MPQSEPAGGTNPQDAPNAETFPASLWQALGIPEPEFRDESLGPAVDEELLLRLVRRELSPEQQRAVYLLIDSFRSWSEAHAKLLVTAFRQSQADF